MPIAEHSSPSTSASTATHRRTLLKGAAWAVPAVTVATAAPAFASSSGSEATVAWDARGLSVLQLGLLNGAPSGGALANASVLPIGAQGFTISNTGGSTISQATADVTVTWTSGIPLLTAKGYGIYAVNGNPNLVTNRTETYHGLLGVIGTYQTSQTITLPDLAAGGTWVSVNFGLTNGGGLGVGVLLNFTVNLALKSAGTTLSTDSTDLTLPVGLNI